jgi:hypothetical protein
VSSFRTAVAIIGAAALVAACNQAPRPAPGSSAPPPTSATAMSTPAPSPAPPLGPAAATPVLASVVSAPIPVPATDGKDHLAYELQLINTLASEVTLTSLAVMDGDTTLLSLSGDQLAYWTRLLGDPLTPTTTLGPGRAALVWLDVAVERPGPNAAPGSTPTLPKTLTHALGVSLKEPMPPLLPATMTETVAAVNVQDRQPVTIAPPLDGPNWLDGNSCCDMTPHRTALNPLNGQLFAAERFAIDYVQLGPDGRIFTGDKTKVESYPYFGTDIHAVADGPVVAVVDGMAEEVPGTAPTGLTLEQYNGNHVVQDIGGGNYAFYAHLKTGSIKVKVGDRLSTGQVLGNLGNTGNTDAPHLHFHVMSTPDPLRSDGLPFVFDTFRLDTRLAGMADLDGLMNGQPAALAPGFAGREETGVSPLVLDVMNYGNG